MALQVSLRCSCGRVRGIASDVSPDHGNRVICYCDDCQAFAHFLERADLLDAAGGTDIYQLATGRVLITEGAEALRCVRLSPKGLHRWYTDCCKTPVGNTASSAPFIGMPNLFMDHETDGLSRDDALGRPVAFVQARYAIGPVPAEAQPRIKLWVFVRMIRLMLGWWVTGLGSPSPFFDPKTRLPIVTPKVLRADERAKLGRK